MCGNPNKTNSKDMSPFHLASHDFNNLCNLTRLTLKKGGLTLVFANHKKGIFRFKRAFMGEIQRRVRQLSNQISNFRLETLKFFDLHLCYYRIYDFLRAKLSV